MKLTDYKRDLRVSLSEYLRARGLKYSALDYGAMVANYYTKRTGHRPGVSSKQTMYPISDLHILDEYFAAPPKSPTKRHSPRYLTSDSLSTAHIFILESAREISKKKAAFTLGDIRGLTASEYSRHGLSKRIQELEMAGFMTRVNVRPRNWPKNNGVLYKLTEKGWEFDA